jgi:hypothetical protein
MASLMDAFNECVDRVIAGESIERCLQDYPEHEERLRQLLETGELVHRAHYPGVVVEDAQDEVRARVIQTYRSRGDRNMRRRSWFFPLAAVAVLVLAVGVVGLALLGPAVGNTFSNVVGSLNSSYSEPIVTVVITSLDHSEPLNPAVADALTGTARSDIALAMPTAVAMGVTPLAEVTLGPIMTMTRPGTVTPPVMGTPLPSVTVASLDPEIVGKPSATPLAASLDRTATAIVEDATARPFDPLAVTPLFPSAIPDTGGVGIVATSVLEMTPEPGTEVAHSIPTVTATMSPTGTMTSSPTPLPTGTLETTATLAGTPMPPTPTPFQQQNAAPPTPTPAIIPLNAGEIDDNARWDTYLLYRSNFLEQYGAGVVHDVDVTGRQIIRVTDQQGLPVLGAQVQVFAGQTLVSDTRTYATGQTLFFPNARAESRGFQSPFRVSVTKNNINAEFELDAQHGPLWEVQFDGMTFTLDRVRLDVLFLLDTTSSMGDEIAQLQNNILGISSQIAALPGNIDVHYGLVTYRDRGDEYLTRVYDFTSEVTAFQFSLNSEGADGGGDEPESLNEGLHEAIHSVSWRGEDTVKLVFLVADAPPHLDYPQDYDYAVEMATAAQQGIKIHPIASSGLNQVGEYILRQIAQYTMGHFVFLTYDQGGSGTTGEVRPDLNVGEPDDPVSQQDQGDYTVERLDELVLRLITDEISSLSARTTTGVPVDVRVSKAGVEPPQPFNPAILLVLVGASFLLGYSFTLRKSDKRKRKNEAFVIIDDAADEHM